MKGTRNQTTVSLDKLALSADLKTEDWDAWERKYGDVLVRAKVAKTKAGSDLYKLAYRTPESTYIGRDNQHGDFHEIGVQFNPNREPMEPDDPHDLELPIVGKIEAKPGQFDGDPRDITIELLACLTNVRIARLDLAIDYLGTRMHDYEFLYPRSQRQTMGTGFGKVESISFGAARSDLRLSTYAKELQKNKKNPRILTIHGELILPHEDEPWLRVEARMKGRSVLRGDAFQNLIAFRRASFKRPANMKDKTAEFLELVARYPAYLDFPDVHENTRDAQRKKLLANVKPLAPSPQEVYAAQYKDIQEAIGFLLLPVPEEDRSEQLNRMLTNDPFAGQSKVK